MCGHFEVVQNVQWREAIVQLRKAFDMLWLGECHVSGGGRKGSRRVEIPRREIFTMDFGFLRSIVAKPFPCTRIEVRRNDLGSIDGSLGERSIIEHRDVWTWARRSVA